MDNVLEFIQSYLSIEVLTYLLIIITVMTVLKIVIRRKIKDANRLNTYIRRVNYSTFFLILLYLLTFVSDLSSEITTYVGLLSAGIAIALREIFINIFSWMFIEIRKPFEVGDRIEINDIKGDVVGIKVFQFTIIEVDDANFGGQSSGRLIDIPNHYIMSYPITNYKRGFSYIWNETKVLITFESDWKLAKALLEEVLNQEYSNIKSRIKKDFKQSSKSKNISYEHTSPYVYVDVKASGIELSLRFMSLPKDIRNVKEKISIELLEIVAANQSINLAYPTKRVVNS